MANKHLESLQFPGLSDTYTMTPEIASEYSSSATYAVGDYAVHSGKLYQCTTAIATAEAWTAAHWTEAKLADDVSQLKEDLGNLADLDTTDKSNLVGAINEAYHSGGGGGGLSNTIKNALLDCFRHVAWIDHDSEYYENLEYALYPRELTSITATFTQDGNVFSETDFLEDLIPFLTVTANYSDGTHRTINDYTLSGSLTAGVSTITVSFEGETATFTVNVSTVPAGYTVKNYVVADGSQYISTQIPETSVVNCWYRLKELRTNYTNRVGHIFSSANMYVPYLFSYGSVDSVRLNGNRYGNELTHFDYVTNVWEINEEYVVESYKDNNNITVNGSVCAVVPIGSTMNPDYTFVILGYKGSDGLVAQRFRFVGRFYYLKIVNKDTNIKTHDFVPCVNSSNVVGIYDLVDGVFYPPTEGTLIAG